MQDVGFRVQGAGFQFLLFLLEVEDLRREGVCVCVCVRARKGERGR